MRGKLRVALILVAAVLLVSACSARTQFFLEETRKNGAHFATWHHMGYSMWRATPEETTQSDIQASGQEKWWGEGEVVRVEPIL